MFHLLVYVCSYIHTQNRARDPCEDSVYELDKDRPLVFEVQIKGALGDACLCGDVVYLRVVVAVAGKNLSGRTKQITSSLSFIHCRTHNGRTVTGLTQAV